MDHTAIENLTIQNKSCPLCQSSTRQITQNYPGYREGLSFGIFECCFCDVQFVDPMDIPDGLYESIYRSVEELPHYHRYSRYRHEVLTVANPLKWLADREPAFWFINSKLQELPSHARILEVGSGLGYLTYAISKAGFDIRGTDISQTAVEEARARFGDLYIHENLADLASSQPETFDAVIMTEVIEHVPQPALFLEWISKLLKPGGVALITTPNKSYFALNTCWRTENPPVHLWWFSETTMRRLAQTADLEIQFCDFSPMYHRQATAMTAKASPAPEPAWLNRDGHVTAEGQLYVKRTRESDSRFGVIKSMMKERMPALRSLLKVGSEYPVILQRCYTMGLVLSKSPNH